MLATRLIARLDIKGPNVVKGVRMEGLRVIGNPIELARKYAEEGAHELLYIDTVASLYGRNQLASLVMETSESVFIPITVGGGIKGREDVRGLLVAGADKISLNTYALSRPSLVRELHDELGAQAITVSIQAKKTPQGWEAYTEGGRQRTGKDAIQWAEEAVRLGAGELLITSIDQDGTMKGFDLDLIRAIQVPVPVVACGGLGSVEHMHEALDAGADAIACASALHYGKVTLKELEDALSTRNILERQNSIRGIDRVGKDEGRCSSEFSHP